MQPFSNQSVGDAGISRNLYRTQQASQEFDPSISQVVGAYVDEVFSGVGSLEADLRASDVTIAEQRNTPLTEDEYKQSEYYRSDIGYYNTITSESAKILAENQDDANKRAFVISRASGIEDVVGFSTAFASGLFEPKNFAVGVATSLVGGQIANRVVAFNRINKMRQKFGKYQSAAARGGTEGLVAAAILEPSNRDSANILRQDYELSDSLFNVALSTVFGAGFNLGGAYLNTRLNRRNGRVLAMEELDTAASQLAEGRKIDVSTVEAIKEGGVIKKPIAEKAEAVEQFVKYTETAEFKSKFEGSKVVDAEGKPLRVYHGTNKDFKEFGKGKSRQGDIELEATFFSKQADYVEEINNIRKKGARTIPAYLNLKKPKIVELESNKFADPSIEKIEITQAKVEGFDSVIFKDKGSIDEFYAVFDNSQIIPAFGEGVEMDTIAKQIDTASADNIRNTINEVNRPNNSTVYDEASLNEFDSYKAKYPDEMTTDQIIDLENEIDLMREAGLLDDESLQALDDLKEFDLDTYNKGLDAAYICLTRG